MGEEAVGYADYVVAFRSQGGEDPGVREGVVAQPGVSYLVDISAAQNEGVGLKSPRRLSLDDGPASDDLVGDRGEHSR